MDPVDIASALDAPEGESRRSRQGHLRRRPRTVGGPACNRQSARRAVSKWPTAQSLVARLVSASTTAADHEADPNGGASYGGSPTDPVAPPRIAVDVAPKVVERQIRLG